MVARRLASAPCSAPAESTPTLTSGECIMPKRFRPFSALTAVGQRARDSLFRFRRDTTGSVAAIVSIVSPVLVGAMGLGGEAGEDRNEEQGGTLWRVDGKRLEFDRRSRISWDRVRVGDGMWKTSDPALEKEVKKSWKGGRLEEKGEELSIRITGAKDQPLKAECRGKSVLSEISLAQAEKRPLTTETLGAQFSRLGGTGYQLGELKNELEGEVMIPIGELNRVRRRLIEQLKEEPQVNSGAELLRRWLPEVNTQKDESELKLKVLCRTLAQVRGVLDAGVDFIYCDFEDLRQYREAVELVRGENAEVFLATPRIQKPTEVGFFKMVEKAEPDGVLVRNLGGVNYFKERDIRRIADFSLNVANPVTARLLMEEGGFENLTVSYDLNEGQVGDLLDRAPAEWFEMTMHQHIPMFHMEHCVFCTFLTDGGTSIKNCGKPCEKHHVQLRDRVGQLHTLKADVGCRNTLFNGRAQTGAASVMGFKKQGLSKLRIELLDEGALDAKDLIFHYRDFLAGDLSAPHLIEDLDATARLGVTKGTLEQRREEVHR